MFSCELYQIFVWKMMLAVLEEMQENISASLRGCSRSYCKQKEYCVNLGDEKSLPKRHQ